MSNYFLDPKAFGTTLMALLLDAFGTDCLNWDPESIRLEIKDAYLTEVSDLNIDKIMACNLLLTTEGFYKDINQFISSANALCGTQVDLTVFDPATVEECAWAVTETNLLNPDGGKFSEDIKRYMGVRLDYEGWGVPPKVLSMATMPKGEVHADEFSDDPVMFAGVWGAIRENERLLEETMALNKQALLDQLKTLKLKNGSYQNLVEALTNKTLEGV